MISAENSKYIKDIHFDTADEFLRAISYGGNLYVAFNGGFIFRGHSDDSYTLLPTALRTYLYLDYYHPKELTKEHFAYGLSEYGQIEAEAHLLFDFFKMCDDAHLYVPEESRFRETFMYGVDIYTLFKHERWVAKEYQELAALAQHHGVPTRLLDWTTNINVALYFASSSVITKQATPRRLTRAEWREEMKNQMDRVKDYFKTKELPQEESKNMELWAIDTSVTFADKKLTMPLRIVRPRYHDNPNLAAQKGLFTFWEVDKPLKNEKNFCPDLKIKRDDTPLDKHIDEYLKIANVGESPYLYHITIPQAEAIKVYKYAAKNHCDAAHLFPGYDGVAKCIEEKEYLKVLKNIE